MWELNELLAADRRAKAFSEASVSGEYSERSGGFEEAHWHQLGDNSDADESEHAAPDSADAVVEDEVDATADEAEVEEEVDIDQLLESRYQEGVAEGIRQSNLENQQREALAERFSAAIRSEMEALPRVWPVVTDYRLILQKLFACNRCDLMKTLFVNT